MEKNIQSLYLLHPETILPQDAFLPVPPSEFSGVDGEMREKVGLSSENVQI